MVDNAGHKLWARHPAGAASGLTGALIPAQGAGRCVQPEDRGGEEGESEALTADVYLWRSLHRCAGPPHLLPAHLSCACARLNCWAWSISAFIFMCLPDA